VFNPLNRQYPQDAGMQTGTQDTTILWRFVDETIPLLQLQLRPPQCVSPKG
jgi:hypothetical protein